MSAGRTDESLRIYARSLSRRRRLVAEHPDVARYRLDVAATLGNIAALWKTAKHDNAPRRDLLRERNDDSGGAGA